MYGFAQFKERNYWPIKVARSVIAAQDPTQSRMFNAIANGSFTKTTSYFAANPLVVGDVFQTFVDHIAQMASFNGLAAPIQDAMKWFNFVERTEKGAADYNSTTKKAVERISGSQGLSYFIKLIKDVNGLSEGGTGTEISSKLISNMKRSAIAAKLRVVIQQPTAIFRATAMLSPKYLAQATFKKHSINEMRQYAPIAWWKSKGNYDVGIGKSMRGILIGDDTAYMRTVNATMAPAGFADDITWSHLWEAVKLETNHRRPELTRGSPEYYRETAERFTDIVNRTQVVDSVLHRSQIMRSTDGSVKQATAFMSEPTKTYNILRGALSDVVNNPKSAKAKKRLGRTALAALLSMAANAAVLAWYDGLGEDDEKKEPFIDAFLKNLSGNANPLSWIPYGKDIISLFEGYDVERMDMSALADLFPASKNLYEWISQGYSKKSNYRLVSDFAKAASSLTGAPVAGLLSSAEKIISAVSPGAISPKAATATLEGTYKEIASAMLSGNKDYAERLRVRLAEGTLGFDPKTKQDIETGVATALMSDPVIAQAYAYRKAADTGSLRGIYDELQSRGFSYNMITRAINQYENSLKKAKEKKADKPAKQLATYDYDDLFTAVRNGSLPDMKNINDELIANSDAKDPEKTIRSEVAQEFKKEYVGYIDAGDTGSADALGGTLKKAFGFTDENLSGWVIDAKSEKLIPTLETGEIDASNKLIRELKALGRKDDGIKTAITSKYRPKIIELYEAGEYEAVDGVISVLSQLELYDKDMRKVYYTNERIMGWIKENQKK